MDQYEAELEEQFNEGSGFEPEAETHRLEKEKLRAEKRNKRKITVKENQEVMLNSTILYSVDVELSYGGDPNTVRMDLLHRLLITCSLVRWRTGCDYTTAAQPYGFNLDLHDEKLAPLEVLDLREYAFEGKSNGMKWMEWEGGVCETYGLLGDRSSFGRSLATLLLEGVSMYYFIRHVHFLEEKIETRF